MCLLTHLWAENRIYFFVCLTKVLFDDVYRELSIGVVPYSPLGRGFLAGLKPENLTENDFQKVIEFPTWVFIFIVLLTPGSGGLQDLVRGFSICCWFENTLILQCINVGLIKQWKEGWISHSQDYNLSKQNALLCCEDCLVTLCFLLCGVSCSYMETLCFLPWWMAW